MRTLAVSTLALLAAPVAQAGAFPFFLDVDVCTGQPGDFANRGTQCVYPDTEGVGMVEAGGVLSTCIADPAGGPGTVYDNATWPQSWSKSGNQVTMDLSSFTGLYLVGALAGGGTSGGILVDAAGLATPVQSQLGAWDGVKVQQQAWDDCVNGIAPPAGTCQAPSVQVATSPGGDMILCDDPANVTCEEDFGQFCPANWHLCTQPEFNARNDGWTQPADTLARALGVIQCRAFGAAGHFTVPDSGSPNTSLGQDEVHNCYFGTSAPACTSGFGCNELSAMALCCANEPSCGNGIVDSPTELCDDGNLDDADDCLSSCTWRVPADHGISGTNCL